MATGSVNIEREEDDLLACSICLETYKTPKYLPCLHTFCKVCINQYILSSVTKDKNGNKGFSCPVCRQLVSIGEQSSNRECWAEELPNNHLIISMIDRKALQKQEKLCNVCELSRVMEALCCTCENYHQIESFFKKDIIEYVIKMEKAAKEELTITKKEILIQLTDKLTIMSSLKSTIDNWHRILSTCVKDGSDIQCLIENNKLIPMKDKIEAEIVKATLDIDEKSISFERNRVEENFEEMVKSLGQIRIESKHETIQSESLWSSSIDSVPNQKEPNCDETIKVTVVSSIDSVPNQKEPNCDETIESESLWSSSIDSVPNQKEPNCDETIQSESLWSSSIDSVPNQKKPNFDETIQSESLWSSSIDSVPNQKKPNFDETIQSESLWSSSIDSVPNQKKKTFFDEKLFNRENNCGLHQLIRFRTRKNLTLMKLFSQSHCGLLQLIGFRTRKNLTLMKLFSQSHCGLLQLIGFGIRKKLTSILGG
ncbi:unnamed protein product [Mytilus coruscus]|uniref:RING-type domain-containing protein n=1 Tax=Mytilus coruscus TaxID=42192 RepID=A0A6J8A0S2_MYTCO|nr:unnamed protein product [Mytilus coruscus]